MSALESIKGDLEPRLETLIEHLTVIEEARGAAFFARIRDAVARVEDEGDLLEVFFALSTTAFQGFVLDPFAAGLTDELLAYAEQVSHTFMADPGISH